MSDVVHLPAGAAPPQGDKWVRIQRSPSGRFVIDILEQRRRPVIRYEADIDGFQTAVAHAKRHAQRIGVETIYAIGGDES